MGRAPTQFAGGQLRAPHYDAEVGYMGNAIYARLCVETPFYDLEAYLGVCPMEVQFSRPHVDVAPRADGRRIVTPADKALVPVNVTRVVLTGRLPPPLLFAVSRFIRVIKIIKFSAFKVIREK